MLTISKSQIKKAIQECLKELEKSPKDKRLHLKLGDFYLRTGERGKAIDKYLHVADLFAEEDLNARAIAIYKRVLYIDPKHIETLHRVAKLYLKDHLLGDAKGYYEKILKIKPDDQEAIKALSAIKDSSQPKRAQTGPQTEALPARDGDSLPLSSSDGTGISAPDKDLELHYHLGIGYKEMGLFDYAITELELASEDPSIKFESYMMLGECFREKGDFEQAIKYFERASKIKELPV